MVPQLSGGEYHGQGFTASLCVPHDAAPGRAGVGQGKGSLHELVCGAELLIPGHLLDQLALLGLENNKVADDVQEIAPVKQSVDRTLHLVEGGDMRMRSRVTPLLPELERSAGNAVF